MVFLKQQSRRAASSPLSRAAFWFLASTFAMAPMPVHAITYSYVGNFFDEIVDDPSGIAIEGSYTTTDRVTLSFELGAPLSPDLDSVAITADISSWSATAGRRILDPFNSIIGANVSTDGAGDIVEWAIVVDQDDPESAGDRSEFIQTVSSSKDLAIFTECVVGEPCVVFASESGEIAFAPGTWSIVPEPSTILLVATALLGLAARRRLH